MTLRLDDQCAAILRDALALYVDEINSIRDDEARELRASDLELATRLLSALTGL